jgi:hypothetical protein
MKNVVLFVLLLAAFATASAHAYTGPRFNVLYTCDYSDNHTGSAEDPGWSFWQLRTGGANAGLIYTTETFQTSGGSDTYMSSWSNPVDMGTPYILYTRWVHTFRYGTRCTDTRVWNAGNYIRFQGCSDGQTRDCWTQAPQ